MLPLRRSRSVNEPERLLSSGCSSFFADLYADNSSYQCNDKRPWNSFGDALSEQDIPFPVFYINDTIVRDKITKVSLLKCCVLQYILKATLLFISQKLDLSTAGLRNIWPADRMRPEKDPPNDFKKCYGVINTTEGSMVDGSLAV